MAAWLAASAAFGIGAAFAQPAAAVGSGVAGIVYGDANSNMVADPGEGLAMVTLTISVPTTTGSTTLTAVTGSSGSFSFANVPAGHYLIFGQAPGGWNVIPQPVAVPSTQASQLRIRAVRPLNGALHATLTFNKHQYHVGDTAVVTITLRNSGTTTLAGITAECNHIGDANQVNAVGPAWGALATSAAGVSIPAGRSITVHVSTIVPQAAMQFGTFVAACDFGYSNVSEPTRPQADDLAVVPGGFGTVAVQVTGYPHGLQGAGTGVAGARLVLINTLGCPFVAQGTSNATGAVTLQHIPAGSYTLYIYPPSGWKSAFQNPTGASVMGGRTSTLFFQLVPGAARVPAAPAAPSSDCPASTPVQTPTPAAPSSSPRASGAATASGPMLASTGRATGALATIGVVTTLSGVILTALGSRRRAA